ncbi:hypothetical protein ACFU6R_12470 [Streptomyces sp. NPDC057499]|uniref:hypothetical protein n=1 Tax=Streptomyces sp. NPDC057499 TaxID=3346150 RepID=UPI00369E8A3B
MDGHDEQGKPSFGDLVKDVDRNRVGVLMDRVGGRYQVRPMNGGKEWEVEPDSIVIPTASERVQALNGTRNRMTRLGL